MLLEGRNAVVHGAGGAVGGAVARAFAREGARVALAGRRAAPLERVAAQITAAGAPRTWTSSTRSTRRRSRRTPTRWSPGRGASTSS